MNHQTFTPEEIENGTLKDLLDFLLKQNTKLKKSFNDIHIYSDGYCTIVEWFPHHYNADYEDGNFEYVDSEHVLMKEIHFPDGHYEYAIDEEQEKELWERFHKNCPGWVKTSYGTWTNEIENEKFRKMIEESNKTNEDLTSDVYPNPKFVAPVEYPTHDVITNSEGDKDE